LIPVAFEEVMEKRGGGGCEDARTPDISTKR
jgi:hypothetical protein